MIVIWSYIIERDFSFVSFLYLEIILIAFIFNQFISHRLYVPRLPWIWDLFLEYTTCRFKRLKESWLVTENCGELVGLFKINKGIWLNNLWLWPGSINWRSALILVFQLVALSQGKVGLKIIKKINKGEELLYSYGKEFFEEAECECGECQRWGNNYVWRLTCNV